MHDKLNAIFLFDFADKTPKINCVVKMSGTYLYAKYEPMPSPIFCGSDTVISIKKSECSSVEISSIVLLLASF